MLPPKDLQIDHINGDGLDNRRENLRIVTCRGNGQNLHIEKSSCFPGVYLKEEAPVSWGAQIYCNGKHEYLGAFPTEILAHEEYERASRCIAAGLPLNKSLRRKTSIYPGVSREKGSKRWRTSVWENGKCKHLGTFDSEILAYAMYSMYCKEKGIEFVEEWIQG
jgi:hypothetical protein